MIKFIGIFSIFFLCACDVGEHRSDHRADNLKNIENKWTVVNIWAIWCTPCLEEIPELNNLYVRKKIRVLGVDYDGALGEELSKKIQELGILFPVYEWREIIELNGISKPKILPVTYLFSSEGKLMETLYGPQTSHSIENKILELKDRIGTS